MRLTNVRKTIYIRVNEEFIIPRVKASNACVAKRKIVSVFSVVPLLHVE